MEPDAVHGSCHTWAVNTVQSHEVMLTVWSPAE